MVPEGVQLNVDPKNVREYIRKFHPSPLQSQLASNESGIDQKKNIDNHLKKNDKKNNGRDEINENPELKKWLLMTRQGLGRVAIPEKRLQDALISLNYMISEESFQAFNEVCVFYSFYSSHVFFYLFCFSNVLSINFTIFICFLLILLFSCVFY